MSLHAEYVNSIYAYDDRVRILTKRIVIVRHDIRKGIRYVPARYNPLGFPPLVSKL